MTGMREMTTHVMLTTCLGEKSNPYDSRGDEQRTQLDVVKFRTGVCVTAKCTLRVPPCTKNEARIYKRCRPVPLT